ncbi:MAG: hypothetical protein WD097_10620 [Balneolales bacterium]
MLKYYFNRFYFIILLMPVLFLMQCDELDHERQANRLFVEAYQLINHAKSLEMENPVQSYQYYRQALDNIENIIENYPDTQIAVNVTQQQTLIGEMTIADLKNKVPVIKARSMSLEGFHELTVYLTGRISDEVEQGKYRIRYALMAYSQGNQEKFDEVLRDVHRFADQHWNIEVSDPIYHLLAGAYAETGMWDDAMAIIDLIHDRELLYRSLTSILEKGYIRDNDVVDITPLLTHLDFLSPIQYIQLLGVIAEDFFVTNKIDKALTLMDKTLPLSDEGEKVLDQIEALARLSQVYASHGEFEVSRKIIDIIDRLDTNYTDFALRDLASELARRGHMEDAIEIVASYEHEYFQSATIAAISAHHAKNGYIAEALNMVDRIPENVSEKVEARIEIAGILSELEDYERSDSLIMLTIPQIDELESDLRQVEAHIRTAKIYSGRNERSKAAESLDRAEHQVENIYDSDSYNRIIADIVIQWMTLGRPDRVIDLATRFRMEHTSFEEIMKKLMRISVQMGYPDLALTLAEITDRQPFFYYHLNAIFLENGNVNRAENITYGIRDYHMRAKALADLSAKIYSNDDHIVSRKVTTDALQIIQRIQDRSEQETVLIYVASTLSAVGVPMNDEYRNLTGRVISRFDL